VTGVLMAVTVVVLVAFSASGRLWQPQPVTATSHDDGQDARRHA
jgi:hypothetical protein